MNETGESVKKNEPQCQCGRCEKNRLEEIKGDPDRVLPREDGVLGWDDYFMSIARLSALRSKDPATQVGACIVSSDNRILSIGYNGAPNGFPDDEFPWGKKDEDPLKTKYLFVVHAERNAILNFRGSRHDLEGSTIYVDLFPCNECAKEIVQSGISRVVYLSDKHADDPSTMAAKELLSACGVSYERLEPKFDEVLVNLNIDE